MGLDVEIEGNGGIGEIAPGWNAQEYATPIIPGDTAGGTGSVSFSGAAQQDSLFLVNNNITSTVAGLGSLSGVVKSVTQTGNVVSVTHGTAMSLFDANFDIPALGAGGMLPVVDIASQLAGRDKLCLPDTGFVYSLCGHSTGFDKLGAVVKPEYHDGSYQAYNNSTGLYYTAYYREQYGSLWADAFTVGNGHVYATHVIGDSFSNNPSLNTSRLAFKARIDNGLQWDFTALPDDSNIGSGQGLTLAVTSAGMLTLSGRYRYGGSVYDFVSTSNLAASFNIAEELVFFIEYRRPTTNVVNGTYTINVRVCGNGVYDNPVVITQSFNADRSLYIDSWVASGKIRDAYRDRLANPAAWVPAEYAGVPSYIYTSAIEIFGPVPAQTATNLWTYIQDACTVYEHEVLAIDGEVIIRDIDTIDLNVDNHTPITITPSIILSGRNVEIGYTNARHVANTELYNAYNDDNRVISVKASETVKTTVTVDGTISSINLPTYTNAIPAGVGKYKISDSKGNPVPINLWNDNGGHLSVNLVDGAPNSIEVVLTGPTTTDGTFNAVTGDSSKPLYPGPYKLAYTADGTDYAALSITGTGILTKPQTLKLRTGADELKTAQDVAKTINNPFILSKSQAYDRGLLASIDASGPKVSITGSISVNDVNGFGFTAGSRIRYMDSIYRVTDVNYGSLGVSFTAVRHVKVSDFDTFWNGRTVGIHDELWNGYDASDHSIKPLWFIGDDESIVLMLDTDGNPYFAFTGTPEISVLIDVDGNPYYVDGFDENAVPVYLDETDSVPYHKG